ncbi:MAG TPA: fructosamine kinase family protein [Bacteroidia bacterium]|nr:fructosamine kinase family protein [Bacteroidia bacterium]
MIPKAISDKLEELLRSRVGNETKILHSVSLGGGCINNAVKIETTSGIFFLKWNDAKKFPSMFEAEAKGLMLLKSVKAIGIPEVIATGEAGIYSFIILEFIETGKKQKNFWQDFGSSLAHVHKHTSELFGLNHDNYIGSLPQSNTEKKLWTEFFISERLEKQISLAINSGAINNSTIQQFNNLFKRLPEIIPKEKPSLLHGDLWNGNFMTGADGYARLIDPAVYYGHREMDLGMTKLFGGFSEEFYEAYDNTFPLQPGFSERIDIHNLYPLLVHVNLFGGGYLQEVKNILKRF